MEGVSFPKREKLVPSEKAAARQEELGKVLGKGKPAWPAEPSQQLVHEFEMGSE